MFRSLDFYLREKIKKIENNPCFLNFKTKNKLLGFLEDEIKKGISDIYFDSEKSTLFIKVSNPIFAQEIKNKEEAIKEKINQNSSFGFVKKIAFRFSK
ncbi:MAG: DciA family protein [bacterium]|nr:DciA family protein [bacterium]